MEVHHGRSKRHWQRVSMVASPDSARGLTWKDHVSNKELYTQSTQSHSLGRIVLLNKVRNVLPQTDPDIGLISFVPALQPFMIFRTIQFSSTIFMIVQTKCRKKWIVS